MKLLLASLLLLAVSVSTLPTLKDAADCEFALCFLHPCAFAKCPAFPKAECKPDYCGGCLARFYIDDKEVKC